jgi:hypothetical protein
MTFVKAFNPAAKTLDNLMTEILTIFLQPMVNPGNMDHSIIHP